MQAFRGESTCRDLECLNPGLPGSTVFCANRLPPPWGRTYPIGLDTEVCTFQDLETAWKEARQPHQREHVMPYFYDHQERFRILLVITQRIWAACAGRSIPPRTWNCCARSSPASPAAMISPGWRCWTLLESEPELASINAGVQHKHYRQVDERREAGN